MTAIYQRARPITFDQVIGQEHVKDVLVAALGRGNVGHAYLFSGPRGVGKTTTARLLAMAVNCEAEQARRPCGQCDSCLLVREGSHPDVIELDAASNNSVEDIRDLREKVRLASLRGGMRVWVLDEAHMLSKAAGNALLKTLEEPPENLVFILATTEPERLPATILSRCQHFRFRRLSEPEIQGKLERLCQEAKTDAELEALALVARAADGAMRDAESLLERLLSSGEAITRQQTEDALGLPPQTRMATLATQLSNSDIAGLFESASALYHDGFAPRSLAEQLTITLRDALYTSLGASERGPKLELSEAALLRVIHALDDEQERFVRRNDLFALEVALIKAVNALNSNSPAEATVASGEAAPAQLKAEASLPDFDPSAPPRARKKVPAERPQTPAPRPANTPSVNWHTIKTKAGPQLKAFLMVAQEDVSGREITLAYSERHRFHFSQLKERKGELSSLVTDLFGPDVIIHIRGPNETLHLNGDGAKKA